MKLLPLILAPISISAHSHAGTPTLPHAESGQVGIDLAMEKVILDKEYYRSGDSIHADLSIYNAGTDPVNGLSVSWSIDGRAPMVTTIDQQLASNQRVSHAVTIPLDGESEQIHTLTIACAPAGLDDGAPANNTLSVSLPVYTTQYPRTMLLENFTTQRCVNCPNGHKSLLVATKGRDDVAILAHHVGYGTDEYTISESNDFLAFGVYGAPSLIIDRTLLSGNDIPFSIGYTNPVMGGQIITKRIETAKEIPALASVSISNDYDEDSRELTIGIAAEKNGIFSHINPDCNFTVFLTEDGLQGRQLGYSGTYTHDNVLRQILTPSFGDAVEWEDNSFKKSLTCTLDPAWNPVNMKVIVSLNKPFNPSDLTDSQVLNSAQAPVMDNSGIASVETSEHSLKIVDGAATGMPYIEVYNLQGARVPNNSLGTGTYIVRGRDNNGHTLTIKLSGH